MYEIETVGAYTEAVTATELLRQMLDSPAETFVVGSQSFIATLPDPLDPNVIVHKDVTASGPNVVVCGDARCWVQTPGGVLVFRSGFFADEVRATFGVETSTQQAPAPAPPPVEATPIDAQVMAAGSQIESDLAGNPTPGMPFPVPPPTEPVMPPQEPPAPPAEPVASASDPSGVLPVTPGEGSVDMEPIPSPSEPPF
ncbi:MAG TPA: hypothetical protein VNW96_19235 [Mycobacterium sp.]|jgi:hypothetical protein|nr:hypothetical protein [Mycobacterium sp.]